MSNIQWLSADLSSCPRHNERVWVAVQGEEGPVQVCIGIFDAYYVCWRKEGFTRFSDCCEHVLGWLPFQVPAWEVPECNL